MMLSAERPEEFHFTTKDTGAHECTLVYIFVPHTTSLCLQTFFYVFYECRHCNIISCAFFYPTCFLGAL